MNSIFVLLLLNIILIFTQTNPINAQPNNIEQNIDQREEAIKSGLAFINSYIKYCNEADTNYNLKNWVESNNVLTQIFKNSFRELIKKAEQIDPEVGLGFDPIFNAQDFPTKNMVFESYDPHGQFLKVKALDWDNFSVLIKLIQQDGFWFIDGAGVINIPKDKLDN